MLAPQLTPTNTLKNYHKAQKMGQYQFNIDWKKAKREHKNMSKEAESLAYHITSQSAFAEQIGLDSAAVLATKVDDYQMKLALSLAVADEARHAEMFGRWGLETRGEIAKTHPSLIKTHQYLHSLGIKNSVPELFFIHTLLEALALEEFNILKNIFQGTELAKLYSGAIIDEARHVALGISYLKSLSREDKEELNEKKTEIIKHLTIDINDDGFYNFFSDITETKMEVIKTNFLKRFDTIFNCLNDEK